MEIRFGEWSFEVEKIDKHKLIFSRLTLENLHSFEAKLKVENSLIERFDNMFEEYKDGDVYISDENLQLDNCKFKARGKGYSSSNNWNFRTYFIEFEECCKKTITDLEIEGKHLETYNISQEISNKAIVINAKAVVTKEQFEEINQLKCENEKYFSVIRTGIDDVPLRMRFGRNLWSEKDGIIKLSLVLVEEEYDKEKEPFHGFAEPELSIAIRKIKQLESINERLMNVLLNNKLITQEEKNEIEKKLTIEELKKKHYLYDKVEDVDKW